MDADWKAGHAVEPRKGIHAPFCAAANDGTIAASATTLSLPKDRFPWGDDAALWDMLSGPAVTAKAGDDTILLWLKVGADG